MFVIASVWPRRYLVMQIEGLLVNQPLARQLIVEYPPFAHPEISGEQKPDVRKPFGHDRNGTNDVAIAFCFRHVADE